MAHPTPSEIRAARLENPNMRPRDLADQLGISEAQLVAADTGRDVVRITADMDQLMPLVNRLGEVMALTRNESCVIEKAGIYDDYRGGPHAALVVNHEIDLRMFPKHWVHGFAVSKTLEDGSERLSIQIFDAAGDSVHKIFLRDNSVVEEWDSMIEVLKLPGQSDTLTVEPRADVEPARTDLAKTDQLRDSWDEITDTHQFLQMVRKLKLNRLGAYRMAGAPYVRPLPNSAVGTVLHRAAETGLPIMVFVGNMGCIEIHTGPINEVRQIGHWLNVLDPGFNLHLRSDHIAEVWQAKKATRRGDAISVEAFDAHGALILQIFGVLADPKAAESWNKLVLSLDEHSQEIPA
ncbi:putative hemin transport protein [Ruegeria halocynthiae]|uniref:Putative hemin transport protein n=1 Tax=Ruegeria halocynthiae TaxID=985054 RepID=A0A1H2XWB8_9RHOB|nr:ChuX/HutX family heme-like substrate-binding protein [Ruegeria halocynthiae]SDW97100.1 putative hemin transport protein [Ruegeria halocynthiae]